MRAEYKEQKGWAAPDSIALKLFSHRFTRLGQTKPTLLVLKPGTGSAMGLFAQQEPGACRRD